MKGGGECVGVCVIIMAVAVAVAVGLGVCVGERSSQVKQYLESVYTCHSRRDVATV